MSGAAPHAQERAGHLAPPALMPLIRALTDLKRVRSAGRGGSVAERLFTLAWARLAAGEAGEQVARGITRRALEATLLGDLGEDLEAGGLAPADALASIRDRVARAAAEPLDAELRAWVLAEEHGAEPGTPPPFVAALAGQPRAGVTCPGRGRLMFEPSENHAEHCLLVAVLGVVLAPAWGARPGTVFLAGLAHHLHNAAMADAGFAGEVALGPWLEPAMAQATERALSLLDMPLRAQVEAARRILPDAETPEGRAFHAADTLDRVLQVEHHLRAASATMGFVLQEMELVHEGPVRPFQMAVLERMGLSA